MLLRRAAALCVPALLAFPAAATAAPFRDHVIHTERNVARAAQVPGTTQDYAAADGTLIPITVSASWTGDPNVAQNYATFLGTLPHGPELAALRVTIVPSSEVAPACGVEFDPEAPVLACYSATDSTMVVPGDQLSGSDLSVEYVIAHEYGHHIAANRSNAPLEALDYGPKRWSSYELVCKNTLDGRLAPGNQAEGYEDNPGEAWAEAYARLIFPTQAWRFTSLLKPTQGSLLAAMADVAEPWTRRQTKTFKGTGTKTFKLPLTLDGAFTVKLDGPKSANYDLVLSSGGKVAERTTRRGSKDRIHYRIACRDRRTENLRIKVVRRSGGGRYTLTVKYAG
jgi:hypothetical protein